MLHSPVSDYQAILPESRLTRQIESQDNFIKPGRRVKDIIAQEMFRETIAKFGPQGTLLRRAEEKIAPILRLTALGYNVYEIAKRTKHPARTIKRIQAVPGFKNSLKQIYFGAAVVTSNEIIRESTVGEAREFVSSAALPASKKLVLLADKGTRNETVQLAACQDILNRAGVKAREVVEEHVYHHTPEELASAKTTLLELETLIERIDNRGNPYIIKAIPHEEPLNGPDGSFDDDAPLGPPDSSPPEDVEYVD